MVILSPPESDNYMHLAAGREKKKINFTLRFQSGKCIKKCHKLKVPNADRVVVVVVVRGWWKRNYSFSKMGAETRKKLEAASKAASLKRKRFPNYSPLHRREDCRTRPSLLPFIRNKVAFVCRSSFSILLANPQT